MTGALPGTATAPVKVLLLAGTAEARELAGRLAGDERFDLLATLAGVTRAPLAYPCAVRSGGFGGAAAFEAFVAGGGFGAIVDATHPFARVMPGRARTVAGRLGVPCLRLMRPGWVPGPGDRWIYVADEAAAEEAIAPGARVLLATGGRSLPRFAALAVGRELVVRVIDPPGVPFPFAGGDWLVGRPPFTVAEEIDTLRRLRIDVVVAKDAGGPAAAKLEAARRLGLPVVMLRRPAPPPGGASDRAETVARAVEWLGRLV